VKQYRIAEEGKNGLVELEGNALIRTTKKLMGRDDRQVIPLASISHVDLNRKVLGFDVLTVYVGSRSYVWKCREAEALSDAIMQAKGVAAP
jgi:hypothetical protein